jgi:hypothetical protein
MHTSPAEALVRAYVDGWKQSDPAAVLATLAPDCLIVESHGPTYRGIEHVRRWIESWFAEGCRVDRWEITSFCLAGGKAAFEWEFECTVAGRLYRIDGASWVELAGGRIAALREYRRTQPPFDWSPG